VRAEVTGLVSDKLRTFLADARAKQVRNEKPLREEIQTLRDRHASEREQLYKRQAERWAEETQERADRFRAGLRGLWDNLTGRARTIRALNEEEAVRGMKRDRAQRDRLVSAQLEERQPLQARRDALRKRHATERHLLMRELIQHLRRNARRRDDDAPAPPRHRKRGPSLEH
jgi:hypothetical protein